MFWLGLEGRKKIKDLTNRMEQLEDTLELQRRAFKQLEMEWGDTLDKLNHAVGRFSARQRRAERSGEVTVEYEPGEDPLSQEIKALRRPSNGSK